MVALNPDSCANMAWHPPCVCSNCGISESEAARLAYEIEHGNTHGASGLAAYHMLEERGGEVDDLQVGPRDRWEQAWGCA
jgi:hypothetical protein